MIVSWTYIFLILVLFENKLYILIILKLILRQTKLVAKISKFMTTSMFGYPVREVKRASNILKRDFNLVGSPLRPCHHGVFRLQNRFFVKLLFLASWNQVSLPQKYVGSFISFTLCSCHFLSCTFLYLKNPFTYLRNKTSPIWKIHSPICNKDLGTGPHL